MKSILSLLSILIATLFVSLMQTNLHADVVRGVAIGDTSGSPHTNSVAKELEFLALTDSTTLVTFAGVSQTSFLPLDLTDSDLSNVGMSVTGTSANALGIIETGDGGASEGYPIANEALSLRELPGGAALTVSFDFDFVIPITAFGTYITGGAGGAGGNFQVTFNDGSFTTVDLSADGIDASGGTQYVGLLFDAPVSKVTLDLLAEDGLNDTIIRLDNLSFGNRVPEPSTYALLLFEGLAGLIYKRRKLAL